MKTTYWIIKDWAGNIKFNGKKFGSFDDADSFLHNHFDDNNLDYDTERGEFNIVEIKDDTK